MHFVYISCYLLVFASCAFHVQLLAEPGLPCRASLRGSEFGLSECRTLRKSMFSSWSRLSFAPSASARPESEALKLQAEANACALRASCRCWQRLKAESSPPAPSAPSELLSKHLGRGGSLNEEAL